MCEPVADAWSFRTRYALSMAHLSRRLSLTRNAIDVARARVGTQRSTFELEELRGRIDACLEQAERWAREPPTDEQREQLMRRVLELHVDTARTEREILNA
jgi:hypothetical protein